MVFVVGGLTTNILPTNEATLSTFTYNPSSNHENIIHEMSQYFWTTNILSPENYLLYGILKKSAYIESRLALYVSEVASFR